MKDIEYDKNKLLKILIKELEKDLYSFSYNYYAQEGYIIDKMQQLLNIIKVMNGDMPFEEWYLKDLLDKEK